MANQLKTRSRIGASASWAVLGLLLTCGGEAVAQTVPGQSGDAVAPDVSEASPADILVVGSRASQQSANDRKKRAKTATDSIVADDIGSFPDRNVAEAVSRIPGVALGRNEFGEGADVAIRGNGPDLTRVELDGVGMTSTTGLAISNDSARSADLRELPADLVKSIDVVKGSTADMTEGSLGGGIQIKTRTGLDFAKPYFSLRAGGNMNSLGKKWLPDFNGVASRKFLNDRLGVIVSGSYSKIQNNGHGYENTTSSNNNYARDFDFDNSPEKTFEYNINTLGTDDADKVFANSTETPRSLLTKSIAAKTKADCFTALPYSTGNANQRAQRILEQQTCLNQWNDATPSLIRHFMNEQTDERYTIDGRFDYQLLDNLTVFVKGTYTGRNVHDQNRSRTPVSLFNANVAGTFVDTTTGTPRVRSVSPTAPAGYYLYPGLVNQGNNPTIGNVLNVIPDSIVVDENHNVTKMTLTNNSVGIDQIENRIKTRTKFAQTGFAYNGDRLDIEGFAGLTIAESSRGDMRTSRNSLYGDATLVLQDNGLWDIQLPDGYDDTDVNNFVQLRPAPCISGGTNPATCIAQAAVTASVNGPATPAYTSNQLPLTTPGFSVSYSPALAETSERLAKLDATYKTDGLIPFITRIKIGGQYRKSVIDAWRGNGNDGFTVKDAVGDYLLADGTRNPNYQPPIVVPTALVRGTLRACQPSATSTVSCNYGFVPSTSLGRVRYGVDTLTPDELRALFARTIDKAGSAYFGDLPNRGNLPPAWDGIRTDELFSALGASQFMNFDCLKTCMGSDGQMYDQPKSHTEETVKNIYAMAEFEQQLPAGLLFNGNVGIRGVFTNVKGSGLQTLQSITVPNPSDPTTIVTQTFRQNITLNASTTDWLPSVNLNLWGFNESVVLRLYGGKTVARPNISRLMPAGTCVIDERLALDGGDDDIYGCSGRVGNPGLKPFTAWNYNASLEWYPNKDTLLSVTYGKLDVQIGNPIAVTEQYKPFAGSDAVDPVTGKPLADLTFDVPTWENGPGYKRSIWEFQAKTAFTFLPWFLKYTGADVNYSRLASNATTGMADPLSGDIMPQRDESKDYFNASLWYDDGKLNLRVAYQKRSEVFRCITPCSSSGSAVNANYPGDQWTNIRLPYNPGIPRFSDATTFIDAKVSYNIDRNFQVYLEGRNVTREAQTISSGGYYDFADGTPKVFRMNYGGRRIMAGARIQFGGKK
ncbi:TonB-dependent receptor [Sphingomonas cannabina]|uniref:TonB-dependent receptor n=1 Tax=Sphingomonas cannabina TaxID=2899123 RepID=UPI001F40DB3C|nr:TonB-dependent receptor [Sphingomonas cannabina]UIJ45030.1 TonB-dependent receptor [Sphingomonas cannabina]